MTYFPRPSSVCGRGSVGLSLLLVFPLLLVYEIGLWLGAGGHNGVDFLTGALWDVCGHSRAVFLGINLGVALVFGYFVVTARAAEPLAARLVATVMESAAWAALWLVINWWVVHHLLAVGTGHAVVLSAGAGVYEELVFRLGLMMGGAALIRACGLRHPTAMVVAMVGSALLFSAAHHVIGHDPWNPVVFADRAVAGLLFGLIAYYRSLATAVYTHFLFDVGVFLLLA